MDDDLRPTVTPTPTATIVPEPDAIPLTVACEDLISAQTFYDYNPNFSLLTDYSPGVGTLAAQALTLKGVACRWINQTSGVTIDISAAQLTEPSLARAVADAQSLGATDAFGPEGYFGVSQDAGIAEVFTGAFWVTAVSNRFLEAGDAAPLMSSALAALG